MVEVKPLSHCSTAKAKDPESSRSRRGRNSGAADSGSDCLSSTQPAIAPSFPIHCTSCGECPRELDDGHDIPGFQGSLGFGESLATIIGARVTLSKLSTCDTGISRLLPVSFMISDSKGNLPRCEIHRKYPGSSSHHRVALRPVATALPMALLSDKPPSANANNCRLHNPTELRHPRPEYDVVWC